MSSLPQQTYTKPSTSSSSASHTHLQALNYNKNKNKNSNRGPSSPKQYSAPSSSAPVVANFSSHNLTVGCGVCIFHLASARVVLCYHTKDRYYFLPKGRKDVGETHEQAACREGFEESGFRCRLLPLWMVHRQPVPAVESEDEDESESEGEDEEEKSGMEEVGSTTTISNEDHDNDNDNDDIGSSKQDKNYRNPAKHNRVFAKEAHWCQLVPQSSRTQYMLYWYVAETVPPDIEQDLCSLDEKWRERQRRKHQAKALKALTASSTSSSAASSVPDGNRTGSKSTSSSNGHHQHDSTITTSTTTTTSSNPSHPKNPPYNQPPAYPSDLPLKTRISLEPAGYEPTHHANTGVDEEEALYSSELVDVPEAMERLRGSVMADVVRRGWEGVRLRMIMEEEWRRRGERERKQKKQKEKGWTEGEDEGS